MDLTLQTNIGGYMRMARAAHCRIMTEGALYRQHRLAHRSPGKPEP